MKKLYVIIPLVLVLGIGVGLFVTVSAEEGIIPSWIKNTAGFWVDGQIGDQEFIQALQYLVEKDILKIPKQNDIIETPSVTSNSPNGIPVSVGDDSFSGVTCYRSSENFVKVSGKYTNHDNQSYEVIYFALAVLDNKGNVLTGREAASINDVEPSQTKIFSFDIIWDKDFSSCYIEVNTKY